MTVLDRQSAVCGCEHAAKSLIDMDEAIRRVRTACTPVRGSERVSITRCHGRILSKPVVSQSNLPPFHNSGMDGYAVRAKDIPDHGTTTLTVCGRVAAGTSDDVTVGSGTAIRIFTGAAIPRGSDAVVMQEAVKRNGGRIRVSGPIRKGENIRQAGEDAIAGALVLNSGCRLTPRSIAAAAACGVDHVHVRRKLRVGLVVTGDEVATGDQQPSANKISDVNTPMLSAALDRADLDLTVAKWVPDTLADTRAVLASLAQNVDLIVTTGGVSVGEEDHVKPAFKSLGATIHFSGVAVKPGKPVTFGTLGSTYWLGLPGNPHSAFAIWKWLGEEILGELAGLAGSDRTCEQVVLSHSLRHKPGRSELRPAKIIGVDPLGRKRVETLEGVHSGRITQLAAMDGHVIIPRNTSHCAEGTSLVFQPYDL